MNPSDKIFSLLRSGLWGLDLERENLESVYFDDSEWEQVYDFSKKQSVVGVIYDGILKLPAHLQPPKKLLIQWYSDVSAVERNNSEMNRVIAKVMTFLLESEISPILLKGQSLGRFYNNPSRRQTGDVDILISEKTKYHHAKQLLLLNNGKLLHSDNLNHEVFLFDDQHIELHSYLSLLQSPFRTNRFKRYYNNYLQYYNFIEINGVKTRVLEKTINTLYIFIHLLTHFFSGGVGLRQFCDLAYFVDKNSDRIDWVEFDKMIEKLDLEKIFAAFCHIEVDYIGLDGELIQSGFYTEGKYDKRKLSVMLEEVMETGNFGIYDEREGSRPKEYWKGKLYTLKRVFIRSFRLWKLFPSDVFWTPLAVIYRSIAVQLRHLLFSK